MDYLNATVKTKEMNENGMNKIPLIHAFIPYLIEVKVVICISVL